MKSPAVRSLVKEGKVRVVRAIYDLGTGKVDWLPAAKIRDILKRVEASPDKGNGGVCKLRGFPPQTGSNGTPGLSALVLPTPV